MAVVLLHVALSRSHCMTAALATGKGANAMHACACINKGVPGVLTKGNMLCFHEGIQTSIKTVTFIISS